MAAPSKLTPELQDMVVEGLNLGMYLEDTADLVEVSPRTLHNWKKKGKEDHEAGIESPECAFFLAIKKARATGRKTALEVLRDHSFQNWQAAAWVLERTAPEFYSRTRRPAFELKGNTPHERIEHLVQLTANGKITPDDLKKITDVIINADARAMYEELAEQMNIMHQRLNDMMQPVYYVPGATPSSGTVQ